jgi:hypothetical protein
MEITFERIRPNVVLIRYPAKFSPEEFQQHCARMAAILKESTEPFAMICDTIGAQTPNGRDRQAITEVYAQYDGIWRERCAGSAMVVDSKFIRGVLDRAELGPPAAISVRHPSDYGRGRGLRRETAARLPARQRDHRTSRTARVISTALTSLHDI